MLTVFKNTLAFDPSKIAAICLTPYAVVGKGDDGSTSERCEIVITLYGSAQPLTIDVPADEAKPFANKLLSGDLGEFATKFTDDHTNPAGPGDD